MMAQCTTFFLSLCSGRHVPLLPIGPGVVWYGTASHAGRLRLRLSRPNSFSSLCCAVSITSPPGHPSRSHNLAARFPPRTSPCVAARGISQAPARLALVRRASRTLPAIRQYLPRAYCSLVLQERGCAHDTAQLLPLPNHADRRNKSTGRASPHWCGFLCSFTARRRVLRYVRL